MLFPMVSRSEPGSSSTSILETWTSSMLRAVSTVVMATSYSLQTRTSIIIGSVLTMTWYFGSIVSPSTSAIGRSPSKKPTTLIGTPLMTI